MRHNQWKVGMFVGTAAVGLVLGGCGSDSGSGGDSTSADGPRIGFVSSANNEWGTCLVSGVEAEAKKKDIDVMVSYSNADPAKELSNLEDLIAQQVDAIVLNTVSVDALSGGIAKAKAAGIPLYLTAVVPEKLDDVLGAAVVDLPGAGALAAGWIAKDAGDKAATVAVIAGAPGASSDYVVKGFEGALPGSAKIVANQPGMFNRAKAQEVAENIIQGNRDLDYAFVLNEDMAFGARAAFDAAGRSDVKIVTMNGTEPGLKAVEDGTFSATVSDSAAQLGAKSIEQAVTLLADPKGAKIFQSPIALITKDTTATATPFCS